MSSSLILPRENLIKRFLKKADVLLTVCTHRTIDVDVMRSIMNLAAQTKHNFVWSPVRGDALIDRARSRVASYFLLDRTEDVLLFIDDDIVFEPADAIKLIDCVVNGADVAGANYLQKGTLEKTYVPFDGQSVTFSKDAKPVEVEAVSSGFMAIHRRVFEKLSKTVPLCHPGTLNFYPFFQPYPTEKNGRWIYLSEDWALCTKARDAGFKIFLDPSIYLGHKGEYVYNFADKVRQPKIDVHTLESLTFK